MRAPSTPTHRDLLVWQRAMELVSECYRVVRYLPTDERFELGAQLRRASVSVPANIAEGKGRRGATEFARFLSYALGSLREVETLLDVADALGFAPESALQQARALSDEVGRMLSTMLRKLRTR
jgi:four helix bundle protein